MTVRVGDGVILFLEKPAILILNRMILSTFFTSNFILSPIVTPSFSIAKKKLQEEEVTAAEKDLKEGTFSYWGRALNRRSD